MYHMYTQAVNANTTSKAGTCNLIGDTCNYIYFNIPAILIVITYFMLKI